MCTPLQALPKPKKPSFAEPPPIFELNTSVFIIKEEGAVSPPNVNIGSSRVVVVLFIVARPLTIKLLFQG